jgi:DNA integrity scanning protein DisA with diadenylate cyclase activity
LRNLPNIEKLKNKKLKIIVTTPNKDTYNWLLKEEGIIPVFLRYRDDDRQSLVRHGIITSLEKNVLNSDDIVVAIVGIPKTPGGIDTITVVEVNRHITSLKLYEFLKSVEDIERKTIEQVLNIALELGREGREGRPIGTIFVIGDTLNVMNQSQQLILNPFAGHNASIFDEKVKGTIKELSPIDGAFIITEDGRVIAGGRYLESIADNIKLPLGLGARHRAAAAISKNTDAIAITVSESGGIVRVFKDGEIVFEVDPRSKSISYLR